VIPYNNYHYNKIKIVRGSLLRFKIVKNITGNILKMDKITSGNIYGRGVIDNVEDPYLHNIKLSLYFLGVKAALPPSCADCLKIWEPQPPGTLRACQGL
jgi:hypothetical protein